MVTGTATKGAMVTGMGTGGQAAGWLGSQGELLLVESVMGSLCYSYSCGSASYIFK